MSLFHRVCLKCGCSISIDANFCGECGTPTKNARNICSSCGVEVGEDLTVCCGERCHRTANDIAERVDIAIPEKALQSGLQVDEGTMALFFQDGRYVGPLGPGHHSFSTFFERLVGADKGKTMHAILLDVTGFEVDFLLPGVRALNQVPFDVNLRLEINMAAPVQFVSRLVRFNSHYTVESLVSEFQQDAQAAVQIALRDWPLEKLVTEVRAREVLEPVIFARMEPLFEKNGLELIEVRLASFTGPSVEMLRDRLAELDQLSREAELNGRLREVLQRDKIAAFRDEKEIADVFDSIAHEYGLKGEQRRLERERFLSAARHTDRMDEIRREYEARQLELESRLKLQAIQQAVEIAQVQAELKRNAAIFDEQMRQRKAKMDEASEAAKQAGDLLDMSDRIRSRKRLDPNRASQIIKRCVLQSQQFSPDTGAAGASRFHDN